MSVTRRPLDSATLREREEAALAKNVSDIGIAQRHSNALQEAGKFTVNDVLKMQVHDLAEINTIGRKTVIAILEAFEKLQFYTPQSLAKSQRMIAQYGEMTEEEFKTHTKQLARGRLYGTSNASPSQDTSVPEATGALIATAAPVAAAAPATSSPIAEEGGSGKMSREALEQWRRDTYASLNQFQTRPK